MSDALDPPSRLPDLVAGRYRIVSRLGVGGMGIVYKAIDAQLNRPVAVKVLEDRRLLVPGASGRMRSEALAAASLDHPYICKIYELVETPSEACIVMEFVEGETLSAILKRGPLPVLRTLQIGREIAEGLAAAHARGLVHRDVKPSNVMVTPDGHVKLLDFGIAGTDVGGQPGDATHTVAPPVTVHAGTPHYMAPEQAAGRPLTTRADLFSLGVVLYECLAGTLPFAGASTFDYVRHLMQSAPRRLHRVAPDLPADLVDLVERCLEKSPADRPESAEAVVAELSRIMSALTATGELPTARQARAGRLWKIVAGVALAGVVAVVAWPWLRPDAPDDSTLRRLRPLVTTAAQESGSRISPDGQWVAYLSESGGATTVMVQRIDGGDARPLTIGGGTPSSLVWSPDGRQIACVLDVAGELVVQLYPAFFGGTSTLTMTLPDTTARAGLLRWIGTDVFVEIQGRDGLSLHRLDLQTRHLTLLSDRWALDGDLQFMDVRPDGRAVALTIRRNGQDDLWVADLDGSRLRALTNDVFFDRRPLWSGPGDRVLFQSNRGGQIDLWAVDPASGRLSQITSGEMEKIAESTSVDGSIVSFQRLSQDAKLWAWQVGDPGGAQLTQDTMSDYSPAIDPGGRLIVFQRSQPVPSSGYTIVDARLFSAPLNARVLSAPPGFVADGFAASLSADGDWLAFLRPGDRARMALQVRRLSTGESTAVTASAGLPVLSLQPVEWASRTIAWSPTEAHVLYFIEHDGLSAVRRYDAATATTGPPLITAAEDARYLRDPFVAADGRRLAVLDVASKETAVRVVDLATGGVRTWASIQSGATSVFGRGWWNGAVVLARRQALQRGGTGDIEVLLVDPDGARVVARVDRAFVTTSRLDPSRGLLYVTRTVDGVHNLHAVSIATGRMTSLTTNTLPGVTFSGVAIAGDRVIAAREERRQDLWVIESSSGATGGAPNRPGN